MRRIQSRDPEQVLGVLEGCLRSVSDEVVREGGQITFFGLGPSPRAVNRRDTTVIHVNSEDGVTTISADVRFQASAFLGAASQDAVVQAKLDRVFDDMLAKLGLNYWEHRSDEEKAHAGNGSPAGMPSVEEAIPEPQIEVLPEVVAEIPELTQPEAEAWDAAVIVQEFERPTAAVAEAISAESPVVEEALAEVAGEAAVTDSSAAEVVPEPVVKAEAAPESAAPESLAEGAAPIVLAEEKKEEAAETSAESPVSEERKEPSAEAGALHTHTAPEAVKAAEAVPDVSKPAASESKALASVEKPEPIPQRGRKTTGSLSLVSTGHTPKLVASDPFGPVERSEAPRSAKSGVGLLDHPAYEDEPEDGSKWLKWSAWAAALVVLVVAPLIWLYMPSGPMAGGATQAPAAAPAAAATPAPEQVQPAAVAAKLPGEDPDPGVVVQEWQTAMNSKDAAAQAAFYADPVERYFLRHNLSRNQVKADKQSAIGKRQGDWAVKMEEVKLTRPDENAARVHLIKHFTVQENGKIASEWFVPSLLQMVRSDGRWQITSERDLGWASSMDELGN